MTAYGGRSYGGKFLSWAVACGASGLHIFVIAIVHRGTLMAKAYSHHAGCAALAINMMNNLHRPLF
jgi:hypothetical protein